MDMDPKETQSVRSVKSSSSKALGKKLDRAAAVPSIVVRSPTTTQGSTTTAAAAAVGESDIPDPSVAQLYKVRRVQSPRPPPKRAERCNAQAKVICWAFTNLFFCMLDVLFSLCEVIVYTVYTNPIDKDIDVDKAERNPLYRTFFVTSVSLHGDCFESLIEIVITFCGDLIYSLSSMIFAFATLLEPEDYKVTRCLSQWFMFSVWVPIFALLPRFVLNVVSADECGYHSASLFPHANENAPRIAFWIVNLLHLFLMLMWLMNGRLVALAFINVQKKNLEEEQRGSGQAIRKAHLQIGGGPSGDNLSLAPSVMSQVGMGGEKALKRSGLDGLLPPTVSMV